MALVFLTLTLAGTLAGCPQANNRGSGELSARQIRVVTTIGMITDITREVGGTRVVVTGLMGPGVDPHLFKASEGDVSSLSEADIVFYNGLHLEAKMGEVLEKIGGRVKSVAVTQGIDKSHLLSPPEFEGAYDPHVWFDVLLWIKAVETVRDTFVTADPGSSDLYQSNARVYIAKLEELQSYIRDQTARIPSPRRVLITAHDAFNYFGRAYGFDVRGLQGISTVTEAGTRDVQALADLIASARIPAIFIESSVPIRNIEAVQAAVQARGFDVRIGGELYSDAMGDTGTAQGTYIGMVKHNVDTVVKALVGE